MMTEPQINRMFVRQIRSIGFVDKGACSGADIILVDKTSTPAPNNVRATAWRAIEEGAARLKASTPRGLSDAAARIAFMRTDEGRRLVAMYLSDGGSLLEPLLDETQPIKQAAWAAIERGGEIQQSRDPRLTVYQGREQYMRTPEGRELVGLYRDPDARLTPAEYVRKKEQTRDRQSVGGTTWNEITAKLIRDIAVAYGIDLAEAQAKLREEHPGIWRAYEHERAEQRRGG
jgi:hypothetical protein